MDQTPSFKTSDLAFAAYLKMAEVPFRGVERDGQRMLFIFEASDTIRDLKNEFFGRVKIKMSPLSYNDELKALKAMLHMG